MVQFLFAKTNDSLREYLRILQNLQRRGTLSRWYQDPTQRTYLKSSLSDAANAAKVAKVV